MKLHKFFTATLILSASIFAFNASNASASRVRTVPSSTDQKKKDCQKSSPIRQTADNSISIQKNSDQVKQLQANLWIGNGGTPK